MKRRNARQKRLFSVKGVIDIIRGNAFVKYEKGEVFIPKKYLFGAMLGDKVEADVYADKGVVKKIISYGVTEISAVCEGGSHTIRAIPDDKRYGRFFYATGDADRGERVIVRLDRKNGNKCKIVKRLGKAGDLSADIERYIFSLGVEQFGEKTLAEADAAAAERITIGDRRDFTSQPCFTIDGENSKDFDDAVYAVRTESGFKLWVHIADVAHYVPYRSHLDKQAFQRGNSFYYGENVIPMLPKQLSDGVCSLSEGDDRYTLSVAIDYDRNGKVLDGEVTEGVIRSVKRMTYEKAQRALDGETDIYPDEISTLKVLKELRDVLKKKRDAGGNIDFDIVEPKFAFSEGVPVKAEAEKRLATHSIIEECMIAANTFVAAYCLEKKLPLAYRVHLAPSEEKTEQLNAYLLAAGERQILPTSESIAAMLASVSPNKKRAVSVMTLRCMQKACYSTECKGHFSLALKEYCHFTSPIRRYADLVVHRVLKEHLRGGDCKKFAPMCKDAAARASERERLCEKVARSINDLYMCEYMSRFVGERFTGRISGLTEWGIFVELDNTAEGVIRTDELGYVRFDERSMTLSTSRRQFGLGDEIDVVLVAAREGNLIFKPQFA